MKKLFPLLAAAFISSCGGKSGKDLAQEICDCSKKANGLPTTDPTREQAQKDCTAKSLEAWNKVKDNQKEADEYNKVIGACAEEQIKKSFGK
jgi:chorismate mutase